ncbi:hypothetical protein Patl1_28283 [Pistacia atlantica]|uniref:Uncharacterized protein n=1 Tax=Pistacia atlantica TaxID=434234 RepID=A0ACC1BET8_9ROSI|nr:hypothetical protein Patl1_28283 [Pistacia atlantica]
MDVEEAKIEEEVEAEEEEEEVSNHPIMKKADKKALTLEQMYKSKTMFVELNEPESANITCGDNSEIPVKGKGKILIRLKNGRHQFIYNIYYMPTMKSNVLSFANS